MVNLSMALSMFAMIITPCPSDQNILAYNHKNLFSAPLSRRIPNKSRLSLQLVEKSKSKNPKTHSDFEQADRSISVCRSSFLCLPALYCCRAQMFQSMASAYVSSQDCSVLQNMFRVRQLSGGSRKNSIRLHRNRHKHIAEAARTDALEKIVKRRRKAQAMTLKYASGGLMLTMNNATVTNSSLALKASQMCVQRDIEHGLPIFKHPKKAMRRASRSKSTLSDKKEARRRLKIRARLEQHGRHGPALYNALVPSRSPDEPPLRRTLEEVERILGGKI